LLCRSFLISCTLLMKRCQDLPLMTKIGLSWPAWVYGAILFSHSKPMKGSSVYRSCRFTWELYQWATNMAFDKRCYDDYNCYFWIFIR
jgi:hypothetical protein